MPQVNLWIRKEDLDIWNTITDRASWLHEALQRTGETTREFKLPQFDKPITVKRSYLVCKNGHVLDFNGYCSNLECEYGK